MRAGTLLSGRKEMKRKTKRNIFIACMLVWPILHFLVYNLYINSNVLVLAFQKLNYITGEYEWAGLFWFKKVLSDIVNQPVWPRSILNSFILVLGGNGILLPISVIAAYFFFRKVPGTSVYRIIFYLPNIISIVIMTMSFSFMFDSTFGVVNQLLDMIGLAEWKHVWLGERETVMPMLLVYMVWAGIGGNIVLLNGAMSRIPTELVEYGRMEGLGVWGELTKVVLPLTWPTVSTMFIMGINGAFTIFMQPQLLTGGGPDNASSTIALLSIGLVTAGEYNHAAALGVIIAFVGTLLVMGTKWVVERFVETEEY